MDIMRRTSIVIFEILEKAWATRNCSLIDMKIEFGVDTAGNVIVADVIDSDSWRLWPSGDKRLMKDKQVYRNLATVEQADLQTIKSNFQWISEQLDNIVQRPPHQVVIIMGSATDADHCEKIAKQCRALGLTVEQRVASAHKATESTLRVAQQYEGLGVPLVFIAVAGRSNGLGPVLSGNTSYPVINCPPVRDENVAQDVWSSLNVPSGLGCATVRYPEAAALNAAASIGLTDYVVWAKLRVRQLKNLTGLLAADGAILAGQKK